VPANNINHVVLIGNLTKDPELKETSNGKHVCELRLANNTSYKKDNEWESKPNFFQVSVWGKTGENAAKYLSRGSKVCVEGRLEWQSWPSSDDPKKMNSRVVIIAQNVEYLSVPKETVTDTGDAAPDSADGGDDDIPF
jgi:single-strand DNA-binding protein